VLIFYCFLVRTTEWGRRHFSCFILRFQTSLIFLGFL
jgi:hypothetical protein